jgi:GR25 family glycosyltransferase involved in LPS biosynthesis
MRLPEAQISALLGSHGKNVDEAPRSHLTLTRPAVGCFLSHLAIWRWLIDGYLPRALILEDDAAPTAVFSGERFQTAFVSTPDDAGLVFPVLIIMGGLADRPAVSGLARIYYFNGTFAYFVTPAMCQSLLRHLTLRTRRAYRLGEDAPVVSYRSSDQSAAR